MRVMGGDAVPAGKHPPKREQHEQRERGNPWAPIDLDGYVKSG
jgi:hypothetical protein